MRLGGDDVRLSVARRFVQLQSRESPVGLTTLGVGVAAPSRYGISHRVARKWDDARPHPALVPVSHLVLASESAHFVPTTILSSALAVDELFGTLASMLMLLLGGSVPVALVQARQGPPLFDGCVDKYQKSKNNSSSRTTCLCFASCDTLPVQEHPCTRSGHRTLRHKLRFSRGFRLITKKTYDSAFTSPCRCVSGLGTVPGLKRRKHFGLGQSTERLKAPSGRSACPTRSKKH